MAKPRKKSAAPEPTIFPYIGDKVTIPRSSSILEVEYVTPMAARSLCGSPGPTSNGSAFQQTA